ncbi:hypothetical protein Tco_1306649, partial [Tanacetum coccineum]
MSTSFIEHRKLASSGGRTDDRDTYILFRGIAADGMLLM